MSNRVLAVALTMWGGVNLAFGGATVTAFPDGVPNYFSGTNARVFGLAEGDGTETDGFYWIQIYLNDELIESDMPIFGGYFMVRALASDMFASNHFAHGSEVKVQIKAMGTDGVVYESPAEYVPVHNYAHVFGRFDLEVEEVTWFGEYVYGDESWNGVPTVSTEVGTMKYELFSNTSLGWDNEDYFGPEFYQSSLCYVNTHGGIDQQAGETSFWTDKNDYNFYEPTPPGRHPGFDYWYITGVFDPGTAFYDPVKPKRVEANGTGLPPFNTGFPPINLVYLDGCSAGDVSQRFSEAYLYPYGNAYAGTGSIPENQALCAYRIDVYLHAAAPVAEEFWWHLKQGYTAHEARQAAFLVYQAIAAEEKEQIDNATEWMAIYGDHYTRINGVYTGTTNGSWSDWHL